jgi:hypothetical protein
MNVYLLPHHRLDPRFRYTLEREAPARPDAAGDGDGPLPSFRRRVRNWARQAYRKLKVDYDNVVHGHEQIRLSRLVLMMDRDPDLTLVIPAGMSREDATESVRGVIRSGLMALRSHAIRNVLTALVMMIVLFAATPTHFAAIVLFPLIGLYAWGRYWEDRLIRRRMNHLLEVGLSGNGQEHFREEPHLSRLEELFRECARPEAGYSAAIEYLDRLDGQLDGNASPQHTLMHKYYSDIGRLDPYERYQDRIRKKLIETVKLVAHHLWEFWKGSFRWSLSTTRVIGIRVPNLLFVLLGGLALGYAGIWYFSWKSAEMETFPRFVRASVELPGHAKIRVEAWPREIQQSRGSEVSHDAAPSEIFEVACPVDSSRIDLWRIVSEMLRDHASSRSGTVECQGAEGKFPHPAAYEIRIKY